MIGEQDNRGDFLTKIIFREVKYMELKEICKDIRCEIMNCIGSIGVGHLGGCLSVAEVLTVLYFKHMNVDPANPKMEGRDRLVMSKGHAGPAVYATLAVKGYFPRSELLTLNKNGTHLPSHCDMNKTVGVDMTAGSLGQGFSCAVGIATASKLSKDGAHVYAIIGDGESQEGQIWESAMFASHRKLDNLIAFTDYNKYQIDGSTDEVCSLGDLSAKWRAFGFDTVEVDGHDLEAIDQAITRAKTIEGKPKMIILHTVKGKGVDFIEAKKAGCHSMSITADEVKTAIEQIKRS